MGRGSLFLLSGEPGIGKTRRAHSGIYELGDLTFDAAGLGTIELGGCNNTDGNGTESTCDPFTLVQTVPEPASGALLGFALVGLGFARRVRR